MSEVTIVTNARLVDGLGGAPVEDAMLICEDGVIGYAGPTRGAPDASGDTIDAAGRTLMPGLIDCHVHLCFDGVADFEREASEMTSERAALKAAANARRALAAGITTVRDLGGIGTATIDFAWAVENGVAEGPRVLTTGQALTITGGHGHFISTEVDSADEMVKGVRTLKKAGATCIKIIATGGVLTRGIGAQRSAYTTDQIGAAVHEAHEGGLRVGAHAIGTPGIISALQGGVDSIEHGCFLSDDAIKLMLDGGARLVPTLVAPHQIEHGGEGVPEFALSKSREVSVTHKESFRRAVEAGARIASGTDAGTPFNRHGDLWRELWLMNTHGLPLDRVAVAATSEAAGLLGLDGIGALVAGKIADFILLDGDPLSDVTAYQRVGLVAQAGRVSVESRA
jgi:imidazolonepropionase-like amidohydrolase